MKVICIDGVKQGDVGKDVWNDNVSFNDSELIYEGETYTIANRHTVSGEGEYYTLVEKPHWCHYHSRRFAPLSTIDETEIHSKTEKQLL